MKISQPTKALVILGPTSSGKSAVAIKLAKDLNGEVISVDSRQIYKDMDLGTGKVKGLWQKRSGRKVFVSGGIIHYLIGFRSPRGQYNVSHFQKDCPKLIQEIAARGKLPIICGGTGFWISAVVDGIVLPEVEPDLKLRKKLGEKAAAELFDKLKKLDPARAKAIDRHNKIRLIRAIEICKAIGSVPKLKAPVLSCSPQTTNRQLQTIDYKLIGVDWPQNMLDQKIKKRLNSRWREGMAKEVENLKRKYRLSWKKIQSFGLGYYWIPLFLQNKISRAELKQKVFIAERNYAKRQRTWFKRDQRIVWENDSKKIKKLVKDFLR